MPLPNDVKDQVLSDLVSAVPYRDIERRYGVSRQRLSRMMKRDVGRQVARAQRSKDADIGRSIIAAANESSRSLAKLLEACDEALRSGVDPDRYDLATAVSTDASIDADDSVAAALALDGTAHPVELLLKTANAITRQLAVVAKIGTYAKEYGLDETVRREVVESKLWNEVARMLVESFDDCPAAQEKVANALEEIARE